MNNYTNELFDMLPVNVNWFKESDELDICNVSAKELLSLCGGIVDDSISELKLEITVPAPCIYEVIVACDAYYTQRTINFKTKTIYNELLKVAFPGRGTGTNLFANQVLAAKTNGFDKIIVMAAKGTEYNGFIHWGKVGYSLFTLDRIKFQKFCHQFNINCNNLWDYLCNQNGEAFWKENGFGWSGFFDLSEGSENMAQLQKYLTKRGITLPHV